MAGCRRNSLEKLDGLDFYEPPSLPAFGGGGGNVEGRECTRHHAFCSDIAERWFYRIDALVATAQRVGCGTVWCVCLGRTRARGGEEERERANRTRQNSLFAFAWLGFGLVWLALVLLGLVWHRLALHGLCLTLPRRWHWLVWARLVWVRLVLAWLQLQLFSLVSFYSCLSLFLVIPFSFTSYSAVRIFVHFRGQAGELS